MLLARRSIQGCSIKRHFVVVNVDVRANDDETVGSYYHWYNDVKQPLHFRSGAIKPKPEEKPFDMVGLVCAVVPGLFIVAAISKNVANFLEGNDLFVREDDYDVEN